MQQWLRAAAVTDDAFARPVLYSWASDATAARMAEDHALFDDDVLPEGPTPYVQRVEHIASRGGAEGRLARALLGHPDLSRRRYAWSRPWPTRLGIVRPYGGHLVRVQLRSRSLIGRFDPDATPVWTFHDLDERPVPLARVVADPSRIAAIYHVRRDAEPYFREYVLCNESMVESWSLDTPQLAQMLALDARQLQTLARTPSDFIRPEYLDTLAFGVDHYRPTAANLEAIADALVLPANSRPLHVTPRRRFRRSAAPALVTIRQVPPRLEQLI
ncbi:MAG: hypothetical protein K0V04_00885 [Deltaproteobacteria bacterium]|nr:hypothetical protein [Deltaproteobacteria bacterium]